MRDSISLCNFPYILSKHKHWELMSIQQIIRNLFIGLILPCLLLSSCALIGLEEEEEETTTTASNSPSDDSPSDDDAGSGATTPVVITEYIHSSLPSDWRSEYQTIKSNLSDIFPLYAANYSKVDIFAWHGDTSNPYTAQGLSNPCGACISGVSQDHLHMILQISAFEIDNNLYHRYSVIAHEYYHLYQTSISDNFWDFGVKWLIEGAAASVESIYMQQYYNYSYFTNDFPSLSSKTNTTPEIYEDYNSSSDDINYSSSVYLILHLSKKLMNAGHSEATAFRMIFKDFLEQHPTSTNWKTIFQSTFGFTVDQFYADVKNVSSPAIDSTVLPSTNLTLQEIFSE